MIEVSAHDHFADLRYHSDDGIISKSFYHNMIVAPGISPVKNQNPGYAVFSVDSATLVPSNLKLVFLPLTKVSSSKLGSLPFRTVMLSDYGVYLLTADALKDFKNKLEADDNLTYRYLVAKMGFDPND